jgi:hypothetical protein
MNRTVVTAQAERLQFRWDFPEANCSVLAGGSESAAFGSERHGVNGTLVPAQA